MDTIISDIWNGRDSNIPTKLKYGSETFKDLYLLYNMVSHLNNFKTE
jgi:hypothetical protein